MITKVEVFRTSDGRVFDEEPEALQNEIRLVIASRVENAGMRTEAFKLLIANDTGPQLARLLDRLHTPDQHVPCKLDAIHRRGIDELRGTLAAPTAQANNVAATPVKDAVAAPPPAARYFGAPGDDDGA